MMVYVVHATTANLSSVVKRKGVRNWTLGCFVYFLQMYVPSVFQVGPAHFSN